jgi:DNA helicase HerA-like ATPase
MSNSDEHEDIFVGKSGAKPEYLALRLANRHGLVTGATGTGKTVTLQVLAEGFARAGVPVFAADIKGDLSGVAAPGDAKEAFVKRAKEIGLEYQPDEFSVVFWDVFGEAGHPIRTTITEMGPLLLTRLLDLNETQEGVLNIAFRVADDQGLLLLDLKDLRAVLGFVGDNAKQLRTQYGNISAASIGSIQRQLLILENQQAAKFFGEPALSIKDFMRTDRDQRGIINILTADKLMENPRLYATFLLWLLSELFEDMPEVGDVDKPKLVFFFDEAHLLFEDAPKALLDKVEQVVRLIRSKGVGVYFVTQNPLDVPDKVLAQLGNRVQHALRAFTARDQKAVRAAAETFHANPKIDTVKAITELGKGEALVSFLEGNGTPSVVERCLICPPTARVGPVTSEERNAIIAKSSLRGKYDTAVDRESAFERLQNRVGETLPDTREPGGQPSPGDAQPPAGGEEGGIGGMLGSIFGTSRRRGQRLSTTQVIAREVTRSVTNRVVGQIAANIGKSLGGSMGGSVGRAIVRGTLGGILRR